MAVESVEDFNVLVASVEASAGYRRPAAFGVGLATFATDAPGSKVLDTYFPVVNLAENHATAAVVARACQHTSGSASYRLPRERLYELLEDFRPFLDRGPEHPNVTAIQDLYAASHTDGPVHRHHEVVAVFIDDLDAPPADVHDVYLRLHLLSHRRVRPHGLNFDGVFGLLNNVVWTDVGPFDPDGFEQLRCRMRAHGLVVHVHSVDKFPRMTDYVVPSEVRVADADRVRLGAHLAPGTTVMHEGFVNFNAGTLGASMVEGRISAGVVVGDGSDIGGGASIMGTLSGGGKEVVSIGEGCLLGANAGIGISLGDNCVVEAGLYVTAGSKVTLPDGRRLKAAELSGAAGILYRRNSVTGAIEAVPRRGGAAEWGGLNADLHSNE